jgi:hypothetical protein
MTPSQKKPLKTTTNSSYILKKSFKNTKKTLKKQSKTLKKPAKTLKKH